MKKYFFATVAVLTVIVLSLSLTAMAGGGGMGGGGMGGGGMGGGGMGGGGMGGGGMGGGGMGGRGAATPAPRPSKKDRLAAVATLEGQIKTLKAAIDKAPATDPNVANLTGEPLADFMALYTPESDAINTIATTINSLRGVTAGAGGGGRGGMGRGVTIQQDNLSALRVLAAEEKAKKTIEKLDELIKAALTQPATTGRGAGGAGAGGGRGAGGAGAGAGGAGGGRAARGGGAGA